MFLGISHDSHLKRAEPQLSPIFGIPSTYVYTLNIKQPNLVKYHFMGKGLLFRSATPSTQVGMVPADPYCEGSPTRFGLV